MGRNKKCEKEKDEQCERCLSLSVLNNFLAFVQG